MLARTAEEGLEPGKAHGGVLLATIKTDKTLRRITFEALDSGTPDVANVGSVSKSFMHVKGALVP